jgi:hypothetical protein
MSSETRSEESGWTVDTLKHLFETRIDDFKESLEDRYSAQNKAVEAAFLAQQTATQAALSAAEKAVNKAESAAEKRFEATNEFREQLNDQAKTFITRTEALAAIERNSERISELTDRMNLSQGNSEGTEKTISDKRDNVGMWVGIGGVLLTIVSVIITIVVLI